MTQGQVEVLAIAVVTAAACALVGTFLVLRRQSLLSDAIGHSVLVGIALAFLVVGSTTSPVLLLAAALAGVVTVALVELVTSTRLLREDAAIGLVFPALFSVGVIVVSRWADGVHLDTDAVLLGELAFAPFDRLILLGWDWGPASLVVMGVVIVLDALVIGLLWKELKLATFDASLAVTLGFAPVALNYVLMTLVSVTAVGAFNAVGSILVVALMIAPPAAAHLLTDGLARMVGLAVAIGAGCAIAGYWVAVALDASIAGCVAVSCGAAFALAWAFAPSRGLVAAARRRSRQRVEFAGTMLAIHLVHHEGSPREAVESRVAHLGEHLRWDDHFAETVVRTAERRGIVTRSGDALVITERGREVAREALVG